MFSADSNSDAVEAILQSRGWGYIRNVLERNYFGRRGFIFRRLGFCSSFDGRFYSTDRFRHIRSSEKRLHKRDIERFDVATDVHIRGFVIIVTAKNERNFPEIVFISLQAASRAENRSFWFGGKCSMFPEGMCGIFPKTRSAGISPSAECWICDVYLLVYLAKRSVPSFSSVKRIMSFRWSHIRDNYEMKNCIFEEGAGEQGSLVISKNIRKSY